MCVATLAAIAAAGAVVSAGASVASGIQQGKAASYQAQVARNNAKIANQTAAWTAANTANNVERAGMKARAKNANVRTQLAANGLDVDSGSAADVQSGSRALATLDVADVAHKGALDVYGYRAQGGNYTAQSALDQSEASFAPVAGALKAGGTLLSNAGNFGSLMRGAPSTPSSHAWMAADQGDTDFGWEP